MKRIYRIEILKSVDGWFYEVYLNEDKATTDIANKIVAILGNDIETVIGKLHEHGSEFTHPRFAKSWEERLREDKLNKIQMDLLSSFLVGHWKEISTSEHRVAFERILETLNPGALKAVKNLQKKVM